MPPAIEYTTRQMGQYKKGNGPSLICICKHEKKPSSQEDFFLGSKQCFPELVALGQEVTTLVGLGQELLLSLVGGDRTHLPNILLKSLILFSYGSDPDEKRND